jgi:hypothetical protein
VSSHRSYVMSKRNASVDYTVRVCVCVCVCVCVYLSVCLIKDNIDYIRLTDVEPRTTSLFVE